MWRRLRNTHVLQHVRANGDSTISWRWYTCGGYTAKVGMRARETHRVVPNVGGLRAWPIDTCSNKDAGKRETETPTPCVTKQAERSDRTGQDRTGQDRAGQGRTGQDRTGQDRTGQDRTGQDRTHQCLLVLLVRLLFLTSSRASWPLIWSTATAQPSRGFEQSWHRATGCEWRKRKAKGQPVIPFLHRFFPPWMDPRFLTVYRQQLRNPISAFSVHSSFWSDFPYQIFDNHHSLLVQRQCFRPGHPRQKLNSESVRAFRFWQGGQ